MIKIILFFLITFFNTKAESNSPDFLIREKVYVQTTTDTDNDGVLDKVYLTIQRPSTEDKKLPTLLSMSPYSLGGNSTTSHNVDVDILPQDEKNSFLFSSINTSAKLNLHKSKNIYLEEQALDDTRYIKIKAHSLGTGYSTGCPTVGDYSEALAGKAIIDWLNSRAKAYYSTNGKEAFATWANGEVGMTGVSYNGTLPIMIAATGVKELKAIVPVASISNWYNYYRANGLVVGPGGYIGEDADELGYYIVRKNACKTQLKSIANNMARKTGDYTKFWQKRNFLPLAKNIKSAVFIIHGQNDWNVKQKHAIELWESLEGVTDRRMFLHRGGHRSTGSHQVPQKVSAWFNYYLHGEKNEFYQKEIVEVELRDGTLIKQNEWPHEESKSKRFYFSKEGKLTNNMQAASSSIIKDIGSKNKLVNLSKFSFDQQDSRLIFTTQNLEGEILLSGTPKINLDLAILNRKAANVSVAIIEYFADGTKKIVTRGWADPQNYRDLTQGEKLLPGQDYQIEFNLEPKQYLFSTGSKIGVMLASTDYNYTIRPTPGTQIKFNLNKNSFISLDLVQKDFSY